MTVVAWFLLAGQVDDQIKKKTSPLRCEAKPLGRQGQSPIHPQARSQALGEPLVPRKHDRSRYLSGQAPHSLRVAVDSPNPVRVPAEAAPRSREPPEPAQRPSPPGRAARPTARQGRAGPGPHRRAAASPGPRGSAPAALRDLSARPQRWRGTQVPGRAAAGRRRIKRGGADEGAWPAPPPGGSAPRGPLPAAEHTAPAQTAHGSPRPRGSVASTSAGFSGSPAKNHSRLLRGSPRPAADRRAVHDPEGWLLAADRSSRERRQWRPPDEQKSTSRTLESPRRLGRDSNRRPQRGTQPLRPGGARERTLARQRPLLPGGGGGTFYPLF